ncbi:O-antigen ligase family protein [Thalassotalea nanhaiensis]|uniref:O-antigen ligase family protein n=1 Tax=Thalassotalea nanhaiensis TaxID=3065648 RepID=A0ABY9TLB7_9GAMM|nr:O-antigen ligase family protein [Colwelliaceae bacterium SQ345]
MEVSIFILFGLTLLSYSLNYTKQTLGLYWPIVLGLGIFIVFQLIQILPLPSQLVAVLSSNIYLIKSSYVLNDTESWMTLALDPTQAVISTLKGISYYLLLLSTLLLINNFNRLKWLLICIIAIGTWQAFYGSIMALSGVDKSFFWEFNNSNTANGSFVYRNHFANFLMLSLSIGMGYLVAMLNKGKVRAGRAHVTHFLRMLLSGKVTLRIALAIMVIAIVLSRSRMGNAAFFIALSISGLMALWLMRDKSKSLFVLLISIFFIDAVILGSYFGIDKVQERIENTRVETEIRGNVNEYSVELIKLFPETGTGGGSYYSTFEMVKGSDIKAFFDHAHNDYLQFTIEYGIPATMWLALLIIVTLIHAFRAIKHRNSKMLQGVGFATAMAIIGMLIHMTVDFNLQAPAIAAVFHIILALAWIAHSGLKSKKYTENLT